ncbi:MAG: sugar ABC transporter permease [Lachnospiraceae bacterium]|nr:sugar ABC transporter permease [Lachnospiraceae bacterium]
MVDNKQQWKAWLYLSPAIILLLVFTVWPIINTLRMAFLEGYGVQSEFGGATFEFGIGNFLKVIQYKGFIDCLVNTILLCVLTVPISTLLALLIAVALNSIKGLQKLLQTIFFLPYVTNSIAIGMVFAAMFNVIGNIGIENELIVSPGIVNNVLGIFGIEPISWINNGSEYWANIVVMVVYIVWNALPFKILVLLGGLQAINTQYYDAAKVDGTSRARVFTRITVPLLSPMLAYVIITGFIGGFKEYTSIVGIFGETMGPPHDSGRLDTMVRFIYEAIGRDQQGRASAAALILFVIIFIVTQLNMKFGKKSVHY